MNRLLLALSLLAFGATPALASDVYKVASSGLSRVTFESDAPVESITGLSTEAQGDLTVDVAKPEATTGTVRVPVASLETGNDMRDEHMRGADWLDAKSHPEIVFEVTGVSLPKGAKLVDGKVLDGRVKGKITIKGVTRPLDAPVKVSFHKLNDKMKRAYIQGDLVRVKTAFQVKLGDFGIKVPEALAGLKLAETLDIQAQLSAVKAQ